MAPREEIAQVEMSQILRYVSRRELERYEQEDYAQQAQAEETARRAEADELAKRRLEKNARGPSMGTGIIPVGTLEMSNLEVQKRPRGRPRGRGRGRGRARGWGAGWGGLAATQGHGADTEELEQDLREQEILEPAMLDTSEDDEIGGDAPNLSQHSSPNFARSSFVANSALLLSPVAVHRRLSRILISPHLLPARESPADKSTPESDDETEQRNAKSLSSATAQLELERDVRGQPPPNMKEGSEGSENTDEADWHRAKRQKTDKILSTPAMPRPRIRPSWAKQPATHTQSLPSTSSSSASDSGTSDNETEEETIVAQRHRSVMEESPDPIPPNDTHHESDVDMENTEDEEEYVVKSIISHSYENGKRYYLVSWEGYDDKSDWLPEEDLGGALELLIEYNKSLFPGKGKKAVR